MPTDPTPGMSQIVTAMDVRAQMAAALSLIERGLPGLQPMAEAALRNADPQRVEQMAKRITDILNEEPAPNNGTRMVVLAILMAMMQTSPEGEKLAPHERATAVATPALLAMVFVRRYAKGVAGAAAQEARPAGGAA